MKKISLDLGERSYTIFISRQLFVEPGEGQVFRETLDSLCRSRRICVVSNTTVAPLYLEKLKSALAGTTLKIDEVILEDGEAFKNWQSLDTVFSHLLTERHDRKSMLVALGGGVIGDTAGFAAAAYQRGIDFIQIPTTLLSQVDSSVGGKTGINHPLGKNMIGAFYQPRAVFVDSSTLASLPARELSAGLAEVIKYGLIYDDGFFSWLEKNIDAIRALDFDCLEYAIQRSCEIKALVVEEDETESGRRAILNLGHTFGHAIEAHMGYGNWLHGEAVAAGMVMAALMSHRLAQSGAEGYQGNLDATWLERVVRLIKRAGLPIAPPQEMTADDFLRYMKVDKKNEGGTIRLVLLATPGHAVVSDEYSSQLLEEVLTADYGSLTTSQASLNKLSAEMQD